MHLPMLSWSSLYQDPVQYSLQATGYSPNITIIETMDSRETGLAIVNPQIEYWPSWKIEPATSCSQVLYACV